MFYNDNSADKSTSEKTGAAMTAAKTGGSVSVRDVQSATGRAPFPISLRWKPRAICAAGNLQREYSLRDSLLQ